MTCRRYRMNNAPIRRHRLRTGCRRSEFGGAMDRTISTIKYYWGKDLSGELQGAGGVGGLLYQTIDGIIYIPCYDNNGNVTKYVDPNGSVVASYTYDAFGKIVGKTGSLADFFRHRFSTKYFDTESALYSYPCRYYKPDLMRWLTEDPIGDDGGLNLYGFFQFSSVDGVEVDVIVSHSAMTTYRKRWVCNKKINYMGMTINLPIIRYDSKNHFDRNPYRVTLKITGPLDELIQKHPESYWSVRNATNK